MLLATPPADQLLYPQLPAEARAKVDDLVAKMSPISWADRGLCVEEIWAEAKTHHELNAAILPPDHSAASVWQALITAAFERIRIRKLNNVDQAAWIALSLHQVWKDAAEQYLSNDPVGFAAWCIKHPLHQLIDEAIDANIHPSTIAAGDTAATRH